MIDHIRNWNTDPRFRSSGALGSEAWEEECEIATGGFTKRPGMSWKTVLISLAVIAAIGLVVMLIS